MGCFRKGLWNRKQNTCALVLASLFSISTTLSQSINLSESQFSHPQTMDSSICHWEAWPPHRETMTIK